MKVAGFWRELLPLAFSCVVAISAFSLRSTRAPHWTNNHRHHPTQYRDARVTIPIKGTTKLQVLSRTYELLSSDYDEKQALPRLNPNPERLIKWIERYGGTIDGGTILKSNSGWSLVADSFLSANETILSIPKMLCIYADPDLMEYPLLESAQLLMQSLDTRQWRARLAIALLSERTKSGSFFSPYLMNLPWEFNGMPIFFRAQEVEALHDFDMIQNNRRRCQFLGEFTRKVLAPLHRSALDPFAGNLADVNAFGWGFAVASSRALRHGEQLHTDSPVLIPMIDLLSHSLAPSCAVIETEDAYEVVSKRFIEPGEELSISYGPLSTDELLADYGFTVDANPHDFMRTYVDPEMLNTARAIMGQSNYSTSSRLESNGTSVILSATAYSSIGVDDTSSSGVSSVSFSPDPLLYTPVGRCYDIYNPQFLPIWQKAWLNCLDLHGEVTDYSMTIAAVGAAATKESSSSGSSGNSGSSNNSGSSIRVSNNIDPRLWAYLRVLYSRSEESLLQHGYDPFLLQESGALTDALSEMHVVRTLIGIVAVLLHSYPHDIGKDVLLLQMGINEVADDSSLLPNSKQAALQRLMQKYTRQGLSASPVALEEMKNNCQRLIRDVLTPMKGTVAESIGTVKDDSALLLKERLNSADALLGSRERESELLLIAQKQWKGASDSTTAASTTAAAASTATGVDDTDAGATLDIEGLSKDLYSTMGDALCSDYKMLQHQLRLSELSQSASAVIDLLLVAMFPQQHGPTAATASVEDIGTARSIVHELQKLIRKNAATATAATAVGNSSSLPTTASARLSSAAAASSAATVTTAAAVTGDVAITKGVRVQGNLYDLESMGDALPSNVREIYRYRIRKKDMLSRVIRSLVDSHQMLSEEVARSTTTAAAVDKSAAVSVLSRIIGFKGNVASRETDTAMTVEQQQRSVSGPSREQLLELARGVSSSWAADSGDL